MSDLTLEEFRGIVSEQDLLAMLRDDAFLIWGFHNVRPKTGRDCEPKKKGRLKPGQPGFFAYPCALPRQHRGKESLASIRGAEQRQKEPSTEYTRR